MIRFSRFVLSSPSLSRFVLSSPSLCFLLLSISLLLYAICSSPLDLLPLFVFFNVSVLRSALFLLPICLFKHHLTCLLPSPAHHPHSFSDLPFSNSNLPDNLIQFYFLLTAFSLSPPEQWPLTLLDILAWAPRGSSSLPLNHSGMGRPPLKT